MLYRVFLYGDVKHPVLLAIGITAVIIIVALVWLSLQPASPGDYTETTNTGDDIEKGYLADGSHEVSYLEASVDGSVKKIEVWYPADLEGSDGKHPVLIFNNGTGVPASKFTSVFEHYASHGFIIAGNEEESSWPGEASEKTLSYVLACDENPSSVLYGKVDRDSIGALGHSQGGVGAFNTVTVTEHASMYRAVAVESPTHPELAESLKWPYDLTKVAVPTFMVAGTGDFDSKTVVPLEKMNAMYDTLSNDISKAMARRSGTDHAQMLYEADGYVTAWFCWQLMGDEHAAAAFTGDSPELERNSRYQDVRISVQEMA